MEAQVKVQAILDSKGSQTETTDPESLMTVVIHKLSSRSIGAMVVLQDDRVVGLISERDVIWGLNKYGGHILQMRAKEVMSRQVQVCSPDDSITKVMEVMTRTRSRHLPVVANEKLVGIVSVGDIVKHRLEDMELETTVLRDAYISHH